MRGGSSVTPSGSPSGRSTSHSIGSPVGRLASGRKRSSAVRNSQSRKSSSARSLTAWSSVPGTSPNSAPSESGATEWTRITAATPTFKEFVRPDVATSTRAESSEHVNMKASRPRRQPAGGCHLSAERATGFEPATSSLGSWHSTPELRPQCELLRALRSRENLTTHTNCINPPSRPSKQCYARQRILVAIPRPLEPTAIPQQRSTLGTLMNYDASRKQRPLLPSDDDPRLGIPTTEQLLRFLTAGSQQLEVAVRVLVNYTL